jgi:hypothetical protein
MVYPANRSFLPKDTLCGPKTPVLTVNEGTVQYRDTGMEELMRELDIPGLVEQFGKRDTKDKNRGNFQRTFGVASSQNVGAPATEEATLKFSGCSHPRLNDDSKHPSIARAFDVGWKVGRKMGIDYCQDAFKEENPWARPTFNFVEHMLGNSGFAAMSLCILELEAGHRITRHTDDANDPRLSGVLNITMFVYLVCLFVCLLILLRILMGSGCVCPLYSSCGNLSAT